MTPSVFLMAGGGTGGHVIPAIAVARELRDRGHEAVFVGTRQGMEAKLAPAAGFPVEWIEIGGLKRVGLARTLRTLAQLPVGIWCVWRLIARRKMSAVFSTGGYAAGPAVLAAWMRRLPIVIMEPNAIPGLTNRKIGRVAARALLSFPEAVRYFPAGRSEVTGLPVREEFFRITPKERTGTLNVLITGGSRGSRTLNSAARESWPLFRDSGMQVSLKHQTGAGDWEATARDFRDSGLSGEVAPFIDDMPAAFQDADLIVCRSGAGAVAELAAAGKPSILVPFPFAADDHQLRNAEALEREGAARVVLDKEMNGQRLFNEILALNEDPARLAAMGESARRFARPGAAARAAELLEELTCKS
jgi:UDP-N-acetylglucosamine--N-acetylmuramyl-(pentapeptide) pyrophosphoryl-undecaprenol N-acetylglucosamine transferase